MVVRVESRTSRVWKSNCHCPQRWWDPPSLIFPFFSRGRQPPMPPSLQPGAYTVGKPFEMAGRSYSSKIPPKCMKNPGKQWGIHEPRWSYAHLMDGDAEFVMGSLAKEKDLQWFWNFFWKWWHFKKIILAMRDKIINIIILSCILFKQHGKMEATSSIRQKLLNCCSSYPATHHIQPPMKFCFTKTCCFQLWREKRPSNQEEKRPATGWAKILCLSYDKKVEHFPGQFPEAPFFPTPQSDDEVWHPQLSSPPWARFVSHRTC